MLYGIDLAKKSVVEKRQIVVVEGYTDVMACHIAGVTTAVATCGTAFGSDHARIARRLLGDGATGASGVLLSSGRAIGGEVIFTFDGDEAGRKAAVRAFGEDQAFAAQTFVAVSRDGMDPCDVRMNIDDAAVRDLIANRTPLFEFVIRTSLASVDLTTAEGRVAGLRVAAPIIATIRDHALRGEYARQVSGWLGMDPADVRRAVQRAPRLARPGEGSQAEPPPEEEGAPVRLTRTPVPTDPVQRLERQVLEVALQLPEHAAAAGFDTLAQDAFSAPVHQAVHLAIIAAGGVAGAANGAATWLGDVLEGVPDGVAPFVRELTVAPLPIDEDDAEGYARGVVTGLRRMGLTRQIAQLRAQLNRSGPADDARDLLAKLNELESQRHRLQSED